MTQARMIAGCFLLLTGMSVLLAQDPEAVPSPGVPASYTVDGSDATVPASFPIAVPIPSPPIVVKKKAPQIWHAELEFGANGATGNSELLSLRFGGKLKRKTTFNTSSLDWVYRYTTSQGEKSENRAFVNGKSEWPFPNSPLNAFVSGTGEYDEFKEFDVRLAAHTGLGYEWVKTKMTTFKTKVGGGASREFGGLDDRYVPEALFGMELEHKFSDRQKIVMSAEYYPELDEFNNFRTISKASYEVLVDPKWDITFKTGVLHRHDSTPGTKRPNDLEYFATILWSY